MDGQQQVAVSIRPCRHPRPGYQLDEPARENLHYWKLTAEENGCFETAYRLPTGRPAFCSIGTRTPICTSCRMRGTGAVTLMSGLPDRRRHLYLDRFRLFMGLEASGSALTAFSRSNAMF